MADEKKKTDYFPDFEYRYFPIVFDDKEIEGIQGPVYRPSGEILHLGDADTVGMEAPQEVFHDGDAKVYNLTTEELDLESIGEDKVLGYVPCPACDTQIPIKTEKRPVNIKCPNCGKKGKLDR